MERKGLYHILAHRHIGCSLPLSFGKDLLGIAGGGGLGEDLGIFFTDAVVDDDHAAENTCQQTNRGGGQTEVGPVRPVEQLRVLEHGGHSAGGAVSAGKADLKQRSEQGIHPKHRGEQKRTQQGYYPHLHKAVGPQPAQTGGSVMEHGFAGLLLLNAQKHTGKYHRDHRSRQSSD